LNILLLVDSLPNPEDPEPLFRIKNVAVFQPMKLLSRTHRVEWPLLVPLFPVMVKFFYRLQGRQLKFPAPRRGLIEGIKVNTFRYPYLPHYYSQAKAWTLLKRLKKEKPCYDLIHCHSVFDLGLVGAELKKFLDLPLVITVYGTDINWLFESGERRADALVIRATTRALKAADAVICVSRDLGAKVSGLGVEKEKIFWVPNGADSCLFSPGNSLEARKSLGWPESGKIVLYAGNIIQTKGLGDLVAAVELMEKGEGRDLDFVVVLAGPGSEYEKELKVVIETRGLGHRFRFPGAYPHERMPYLMRACDIFCLPSWREGWPLTAVEALTCGRPVVATKIGGIAELIESPETGILCPAGNPQALAGALIQALSREWEITRIAQSAERYSYKKLIRDIELIYEKVLERKKLLVAG
jgi:glycosyltransferase involved in cell wall biosynthesis